MQTDWRGVWVGVGLGLIGGAWLVLFSGHFFAWCILGLGAGVTVGAFASRALKQRVSVGVGIVAAVVVLACWPIYQRSSPETPLLTAEDIVSPVVTIWQVQPILLAGRTDLHFNVHFRNTGSVMVIDPIPHFGVGLSPALLSDVQLHRIFSKLESAPDPSSSSKDFMPPGDPRLITFPYDVAERGPITSQQLKDAMDHKMFYYVFAEVRYLDYRDKSVWHTELCEYVDYHIPSQYWSSMSPHLCGMYNGVTKMDRR